MAQFKIVILTPSQLEIQGDPVRIHVAVTSATAVTSVHATIEGRTVALTPLFDVDWFGSIAMTGALAPHHRRERGPRSGNPWLSAQLPRCT